MGSITLDYAIRAILNEEGSQTIHNYPSYLQFAVDVLRELQLDIIGGVRTELIPVNDNNTIDIPNGYAAYTKIGILCGDQIRQLDPSDKITLYKRYDNCGNLVPNPPCCDDNINPIDSSAYFNYFYNGSYGTLYGVIPKGWGTFRYDSLANQFAIDSRHVFDFVALEYVVTDLGGNSVIPEIAYDALKKGIHSLKIQQRRSIPLGERREAAMLFSKARKVLRKRRFGMTMHDFNAAMRAGHIQAPKTP